jgi:hypothetical protein
MQGRKRAVEEDWQDRRIEVLESKIARMERIIGGQWQELDFFESALRRIEKRDATTGDGGNTSTPKSVPGCDRRAVRASSACVSWPESAAPVSIDIGKDEVAFRYVRLRMDAKGRLISVSVRSSHLA